MVRERLFPSFWMAGFECGTQVHRFSRGRLDLAAELQHDRFCYADYQMLTHFGIHTVRDGIRWYLIEPRPGRFDFRTVEPIRRAAERHHLLVIWDICHYGWPEDVDVLHPDFADRYARFARAFAQYMRDHSDAVPYYVPVNELSFLAWAAGEAGMFHPFANAQGSMVKQNCVRAAIAGIEAIWEVDPRARIAHTEPVINPVPPPHRPDLVEAARKKYESQFEALDMLAGRLAPELGGNPRYLDILGFNFYPRNQEYLEGAILTRADPGWLDLSELLGRAYARYGRPFFIAETSAEGAVRGPWLEYVASEAMRMFERGLPLEGICLYPVTTAPDWDTGEYKAYGLWDLELQADGNLLRSLNQPYAQALRAVQAQLGPYLSDEAFAPGHQAPRESAGCAAPEGHLAPQAPGQLSP